MECRGGQTHYISSEKNSISPETHFDDRERPRRKTGCEKHTSVENSFGSSHSSGTAESQREGLHQSGEQRTTWAQAKEHITTRDRPITRQRSEMLDCYRERRPVSHRVTARTRGKCISLRLFCMPCMSTSGIQSLDNKRPCGVQRSSGDQV